MTVEAQTPCLITCVKELNGPRYMTVRGILECYDKPVTVLDLCNQLHVSRRTLQNAFHAILGIGPNAWLKRIRLNAVRRELISPWSQSTTVKDAAMQWGFWHLGQFATDYQQLFAEKPSLTLHQRMREWG